MVDLECAVDLFQQDDAHQLMRKGHGGKGKAPVRGCLGGGGCRKTGRCVFDDAVNTLAETLIQADGLVFGSPVFYAGISGQLKCFMDRLFYSRGAQLSGKPAAAVVSARRGGCVSAFDDINRFFTINRMPVVSSQYWNQVHGNTPDEVRKDEEGLQILRTLARNMAWLLKNLEAGREAGVPEPEREAPLRTNFIR